jgi:hypothetical protein
VMGGASGARLLLAAALAGALAIPACRRKAAAPSALPPAAAPAVRPKLGAIVIENLGLPRPESEGIEAEVVERDLRAALMGTGMFAPEGMDAGAAATARARIAVAAEMVEVGGKGEARAQVRVRVDSRPSDAPGAIAFDIGGQGVEPYAVPPRKPKAVAAAHDPHLPSLTALVTHIARDLIDGVAARHRLQDGSPAALHAALAADGGELREEAIRIVGERQLRDEVPTLLKLLGDDDESVRDAALGALIAMRERRAVRELTQSRSLRDRREMRKIIEAISILGGQEADDYLSFVAATHDDDEIRGEAAAARARLQRREAEAGTPNR